MQTGMVIACILPLVICWYLLHREPAQADDAVVAEVLIEDLTAETPLLSSPAVRPPAIACEESPSDSEFCDADQIVA